MIKTDRATRPASSKSKPESIELPPDLARSRLVGSAAAAATLNYSLAHFRRLDKAGKVPASVQINGRKKGWAVGQLLDFIASSCTTLN